MTVPNRTDFRSILYTGETAEDPQLAEAEPACFHDLNLDQIVADLTASRDGYDLAPFFYTPLRDEDLVRYRQRVYADLSAESVHKHATEFAAAMRTHREQLEQAGKIRPVLQRELWILSALLTYQGAVQHFAAALADEDLESAGMTGLSAWLHDYVTGAGFGALCAQADQIRTGLDALRYTMHIDGLKVTVTPYRGEVDYSAEVEATFARFQQGEVKSHLVRFSESISLDTVEENVLNLVARLNPDEFASLDAYTTTNLSSYLDPTVARVDRELQFYLCYLEHATRIAASGLSFCLPQVTASKAVGGDNLFDLGLAGKLMSEGTTVVTNSFQLEETERMIVITGANQGGKTTFSRTFGQMHWLAAIGLPVPGTRASLFLFDQLFTHYEKEEDINTLHGKLEDELVRIHDILHAATSDSVIIMNEIFNSTTLDDAILLGTAVLREIIDRDILALCVTFIDELTTLSDTTVSMVAAVDPADPTARTFKLVRKPADGLAYAVALAEKYGLSRDQLIEKIAS